MALSGCDKEVVDGTRGAEERGGGICGEGKDKDDDKDDDGVNVVCEEGCPVDWSEVVSNIRASAEV